jgi:hypothetical protein
MTIAVLCAVDLLGFVVLVGGVALNSWPMLIAGFVVLCATAVAALVIDHRRTRP